jgi:hypothetical protein
MESEIEVAERYVREAERQLARSQELLADLERCGHVNSAAILRETITALQAVLDAHRSRLARVRGANSEGA